MTNKTLFCSFYVSFCKFCASLRLKRTVFTRLQIKVRPKGLHSFAFYILIFDFSSCLRGEKIRKISVNSWLINDLRSTKAYVRKNNLFMQNEPKFRKVKFNVTKVITKDYEQMDTWSSGKNEPKTNPNEPKTNPIKANKMPKQTQNEPKTNPIKANFKGKKCCRV